MKSAGLKQFPAVTWYHTLYYYEDQHQYETDCSLFIRNVPGMAMKQVIYSRYAALAAVIEVRVSVWYGGTGNTVQAMISVDMGTAPFVPVNPQTLE